MLTASIYETADRRVSYEIRRACRPSQHDAECWPYEAAGRTAYLAVLHAAQALIFERTGRIIKRHRGVRNELWQQTKAEPCFDAELHAFLGRTYSLKEVADYITGPGSHVPEELARSAVATARRFVDVITELLDEAGA